MNGDVGTDREIQTASQAVFENTNNAGVNVGAMQMQMQKQMEMDTVVSNPSWKHLSSIYDQN